MNRPRRAGPRPSRAAGVRLALLAWALYTACRTPFVGQWDSFDYLRQFVTHDLSDLGFGRPVFVGYNIALWEMSSKTLGLEPLCVASVAMAGTLLLAAWGVFLFHQVAHRLLAPRAAGLASMALLLSPVYAVYSGSVMTEVPMLVALLLGARLSLDVECDERPVRELLAGVCLGLAAGIREQAVVWGPAYLWLIWTSRVGGEARLRATLRFGVAAALATLGPIAFLYARDPAGYSARVRVWLGAIPLGPGQFASNLEASLAYAIALSPAVWLGALVAGARRILIRRVEPRKLTAVRIPYAVSGVVCCIVIPVASLWRDADVQLHPRYLLIALPGVVLCGAALFDRWAGTARAAVVWGVLHLVVFGVAQAGLSVMRGLQSERRVYVERVYAHVHGTALLAGGNLSPALDYYRSVGNRPGWQVLWSGWSWSPEGARAAIEGARSRGQPVYICDGPWAWFNFELQRLDLFHATRGRKLESVLPGLVRVD